MTDPQDESREGLLRRLARLPRHYIKFELTSENNLRIAGDGMAVTVYLGEAQQAPLDSPLERLYAMYRFSKK